MTVNNSAQDVPGVIAPPPLIALGWFVAGLLAERAAPVPRIRDRSFGLALALGGVLLAGWAVGTMRGANTPISARGSAVVARLTREIV